MQTHHVRTGLKPERAGVDAVARLALVSTQGGQATPRMTATVDHCALKLRVSSPAAEGARARRTHTRVKRAMDLAIALPALFFLAPLMVVIALAIRLQDGGPALFRQMRGGYRGQPFEILKFRSMSTQDNGPKIAQATRDDPRVTPLGRFLRRSSLDELPQLLNVVKGDMSLVGPRPHAVAHDQHYSRLIPDYDRRFEARPGITGLAQVAGARGETRELADMERRVELDLEYIGNRSFAFDLRMLWLTVLTVFGHRNAY